MMNVFVDSQPGEVNRPTVFFVHGSMANYLQFENLIENLRGDYNIVAFDAYGCGKSHKPQGWEEYSADEHLEDVKAIVQKYKTCTNHLICHRCASHFTYENNHDNRKAITLCVLFVSEKLNDIACS